MFGFWSRPLIIDADALKKPARRPEVIFHVTEAILGDIGRKTGDMFAIMNALRDCAVRVHAVQTSPKTRRMSEKDNRFHIFFHKRFQHSRCLNIKPSYLPGYYSLDPKGYGGYSSSVDAPFDPGSIDEAKAQEHMRALRRDYIETRRSKHEQPLDPARGLPRDAIAVFLQVPSDVVLNLRRFDMLDMVEMLRRQKGDKPLIIKRHPKCDDPGVADYLDALSRTSNDILVSQANVHDIVSTASHVACVNSGTGFEALIHGKQVLSFGQSDYERATHRILAESDIPKALGHNAIPLNFIQKFIYWLNKEHLVYLSNGINSDQIIKKIRLMNFEL